MFFGNVLDQLSSAALLDVATLESIAADVDAKVESLQERCCYCFSFLSISCLVSLCQFLVLLNIQNNIYSFHDVN